MASAMLNGAGSVALMQGGIKPKGWGFMVSELQGRPLPEMGLVSIGKIPSLASKSVAPRSMQSRPAEIYLTDTCPLAALDPQRGIREAYRVLKLGGKACLIGPVHPTFWLSRFFADAWMLFPKEEELMFSIQSGRKSLPDRTGASNILVMISVLHGCFEWMFNSKLRIGHRGYGLGWAAL